MLFESHCHNSREIVRQSSGLGSCFAITWSQFTTWSLPMLLMEVTSLYQTKKRMLHYYFRQYYMPMILTCVVSCVDFCYQRCQDHHVKRNSVGMLKNLRYIFKYTINEYQNQITLNRLSNYRFQVWNILSVSTVHYDLALVLTKLNWMKMSNRFEFNFF